MTGHCGCIHNTSPGFWALVFFTNWISGPGTLILDRTLYRLLNSTFYLFFDQSRALYKMTGHCGCINNPSPGFWALVFFTNWISGPGTLILDRTLYRLLNSTFFFFFDQSRALYKMTGHCGCINNPSLGFWAPVFFTSGYPVPEPTIN